MGAYVRGKGVEWKVKVSHNVESILCNGQVGTLEVYVRGNGVQWKLM